MKSKDIHLLEEAYQQVVKTTHMLDMAREQKAFLLVIKFALTDPIVANYLERFVPRVKETEDTVDWHTLTPEEEIRYKSLQDKQNDRPLGASEKLEFIQLSRKLNQSLERGSSEEVTISEEQATKYKHLITRRIKNLNQDPALNDQIEDIVEFMIDAVEHNPSLLSNLLADFDEDVEDAKTSILQKGINFLKSTGQAAAQKLAKHLSREVVPDDDIDIDGLPDDIEDK